MKVSAFFAWYDFWIGVFYDKENKIIYFCPLPCCVLKFELSPEKYYEIIGGYTGEVIGLTSDIEAVREEEPKAKFREISRKEFYRRMTEEE